MLEDLIPTPTLDALISRWLHEDTPSFDNSNHLVGRTPLTATLYQKTASITLCGTKIFTRIFQTLDCTVLWTAAATECAHLTLPPSTPRTPLATVTGPGNALLHGERLALNVLAELTAIATAATRATTIAKSAGWTGRIAGTRKTTPGFRMLQKYAMLAGGMDAHRMDLSGMVMLKDNHIRATGSIPRAVAAARRVAGFSVRVDVECASVHDALAAAGAGADVVMLDNFTPAAFATAAVRVKREFPRVLVEGSGGLGFESLREYMIPQADVLSFSVNRVAPSVDFSLKVVEGADGRLG